MFRFDPILHPEQVVAFLGANPVERFTGETFATEYVIYTFTTQGWNTRVLFVDGAARGFTTEKSDLSPLTDGDVTAIFEAYDLPRTGLNDAYRGWRALSKTHFVHKNGRVHIIKHFASITVVLTNFLSYYD